MTRLQRVWQIQVAYFLLALNDTKSMLAKFWVEFGFVRERYLCFCFDSLSICLSTVYHVCKLAVLSTFFWAIAVCVVITLSVPLSVLASKSYFLFFFCIELNRHINNTCCRLSRVKLPDVSVMPQTWSTAPKGNRCQLI